MFKKNPKISIVGMGYVGLPLAIEFKKFFRVIGFDIDTNRIKTLLNGVDKNKQFKKKEILSKNLFLTSDKNKLQDANIFIITVPTPISKNKKPDLKPLISATKIISNFVKKDDIIVYESTVYPGCTEEICIPIIEQISKLKINKDFFVGYSPERINVGDKKHDLAKVIKVVSGSDKKTTFKLSKIYKRIIKAGVHMASSIKVAEAAKIIENSQRDLNIAFINELSKIFYKMEIDTNEVIKAASTKWNFIKFRPGLVGGHCIGVDPYYLTYKAKKLGLKPNVLLSGRQTNDNMSKFVVNRFLKLIKNKKKNAKILILGLSFKENCPDIRNSKVFDIIKILKNKKYSLDIYDPIVNYEDIPSDLKNIYVKKLKIKSYDGAMLLVNHDIFINNWSKLKKSLKEDAVVFDLNNRVKTIQKKISL